MPDVPIVNRQTVTAPKDYQLPQAQEILLRAVRADIDGTSASGPFLPALQLVSDAGDVMWTAVDRSNIIAAGGSASVSWFPRVTPTSTKTAATNAGVVVEQGFVVASAGVPKVFTTTLQSGRPYIVTAQGTYTVQNAALTVGTPNANAMFPTTEPGRISTQVGSDADTTFAAVAGQPLGHDGAFELSLDGGGTFKHVEPVGGPFALPQTNYFYTFNITGQGHPLQAQIFDSFYSDNYGELLVTIQTVGGSSGGGGGGSLLPDPSQQSDGSWLRTSSGTAVWDATPQVAETDMTLSDVTTQNVSTSKHGFAPKSPNDASKFLDGTGAYSTPSGSAVLTTKGDIFTFTTVNAREPVGSNGQVLLADSTQTTGLRWGAVPSGSGGALTLLGSSTLGGSQASFDTNTILGGNISGSYSHLRVELYCRFDDAGASNEVGGVRFNNDSAANYDWSLTFSNLTSASAEGNVAQTSIGFGRVPAATAPANRFGACVIDIPMYAGTTGDKSCTITNHAAVTTAVGGVIAEAGGGTWRSTAAITRIQVIDQNGGNLIAGSAFFLYGVS